MYNTRDLLGAGQDPKNVRDLREYSGSWYTGDEATRPLLYSYRPKPGDRLSMPNFLDAPKSYLQIENSVLSEDVSFDIVQTGEIQLKLPKDKKTNRRFVLGVEVGVAPGKFSRTKTITIASRYLLVNHIGIPIYIRQVGLEEAIVLQDEQIMPLHWYKTKDDT